MTKFTISKAEARQIAYEEVLLRLGELAKGETMCLHKDSMVCIVQHKNGGLASDDRAYYAVTVQPSVYEPYYVTREEDGKSFLVHGEDEKEILYKYHLGEFLMKYVLS